MIDRTNCLPDSHKLACPQNCFGPVIHSLGLVQGVGYSEAGVAVLLDLSLLPHVAKHQHAPDHPALGVTDGGGGIIDPVLRAVSSDQDRVVRQPDNHALLERPQRRVFDRLAGSFVDDVKHIPQRAARGVLARPADQLLGNRIEKIDPALGVGADDCITDTCQRDEKGSRCS